MIAADGAVIIAVFHSAIVVIAHDAAGIVIAVHSPDVIAVFHNAVGVVAYHTAHMVIAADSAGIIAVCHNTAVVHTSHAADIIVSVEIAVLDAQVSDFSTFSHVAEQADIVGTATAIQTADSKALTVKFACVGIALSTGRHPCLESAVVNASVCIQHILINGNGVNQFGADACIGIVHILCEPVQLLHGAQDIIAILILLRRGDGTATGASTILKSMFRMEYGVGIHAHLLLKALAQQACHFAGSKVALIHGRTIARTIAITRITVQIIAIGYRA